MKVVKLWLPWEGLIPSFVVGDGGKCMSLVTSSSLVASMLVVGLISLQQWCYGGSWECNQVTSTS